MVSPPLEPVCPIARIGSDLFEKIHAFITMKDPTPKTLLFLLIGAVVLFALAFFIGR